MTIKDARKHMRRALMEVEWRLNELKQEICREKDVDMDPEDIGDLCENAMSDLEAVKDIARVLEKQQREINNGRS